MEQCMILLVFITLQTAGGSDTWIHGRIMKENANGHWQDYYDIELERCPTV